MSEPDVRSVLVATVVRSGTVRAVRVTMTADVERAPETGVMVADLDALLRCVEAWWATLDAGAAGPDR